MPRHDIEQWEQERAEIEIRHWLIAQHLWAPEVLYQQLEKQEAPEQPIGELDSNQIDHLLQTEVVGRLGCHADGKTYIVPITYVYDGGYIYGHTIEGTKTRMMRADPEVCFEIDHVDGLTNWQSVIAWGRFEELYEAAADYAMRLLIDRLKRQVGNMTYLPPHGFHNAEMLYAAARAQQVVVYRIKLTERTGRFQKR